MAGFSMGLRMSALVVAAGALVACSGDEPPQGKPVVPQAWLTSMDEALAEEGDVGDIPVLRAESGCALVDPPEVGESQSRLSGAGVSTFGETGERYICDFGSPPMTLVIGRTETAEDFEATTLSAESPSVTTHQIEGADVDVEDYTYPNGRAEQTAQILDADRNAFVSLQIETKPGSDLPDGWDTRDTAQLLADLVRS
ncbi:hypothetical protein BAY61_12220 [Prauserella marina]|nr:hypothetical protein BAY61_12220 [Prauserella marina]